MRCVTSAAGVVIFIHFVITSSSFTVARGYVPNCRPTGFVAIAIFVVVVANIYLSIYPCVRACGARACSSVSIRSRRRTLFKTMEGGGRFDGL